MKVRSRLRETSECGNFNPLRFGVSGCKGGCVYHCKQWFLMEAIAVKAARKTTHSVAESSRARVDRQPDCVILL